MMPTGSPGQRRPPSRSVGSTCARCGRPFRSSRITARYCSPTCRVAAWREARKGSPDAA